MEKNNDRTSSRTSFDTAISNWKWRQIPQPSTCPSPRHLHSLVHHNNYLYLFGGLGDREKYLDDLWQYSLAKCRWKKIKSKAHPSARHSHQAVALHDKMILFGGISEGKTMNDLWSFDFATESWKQEKTLHSVWGHSMVVSTDKIIILGGVTENVKTTNTLVVLDAHTFEPIDVDTTHAPPARQYASIVSDGDSVFVFGGADNKSLQDFHKFTITENNQIVTESLQVPSFAQNLRGASLSLLPFQSQLILFGGRMNQQLSDVTYSFALGLSKWSTCTSVGPSPRYHHQVCEANGRVFMYGGLGMKEKNDKAANLNDMWIFSEEIDDVRQETIKLEPSYIPTEIWGSILSHLDDGKGIAGTSVVSKQFYNLIMANEYLKVKMNDYISTLNMCLPPVTDKIKISVSGFRRSGPASSIIRFVHNYFVSEYDPIIEESFRKPYVVDGVQYMLDILDSTGAEEYMPLLEAHYRVAHGIYMVYSITNRQSFNEINVYLAAAKRSKEGKKFPLIIVGNMSDRESERQVTQEEAQEYAIKNGAMWIETSAKTGQNIGEAFGMLAKFIVNANYARKNNPNRNTNTNNKTRKKDRCLMM